MKLTENQIEQLYTFTRQHYVEWYDLQTELVDHLANGIETAWHENPKLSFDQVLQSEFKKFGIFGFSDVVEQRQLALNKKYRAIVAGLFKGFFKLPRIIMTLSVVSVLFYILKYIRYAEETFLVLFVAINLALFIKIIGNRIVTAKKRKLKTKRWLFEETINNYGDFTTFLMIPIQLINNRAAVVFQNQLLLFVICFLLVSYGLVVYIMVMYIPARAEAYLNETYPEYKFAKL